MCLYRALIGGGADANAPDHDENDRETPLHLAAWYGHLSLVKYLLEEAGAKIDAANAKGRYVSLRHLVLCLADQEWRAYAVGFTFSVRVTGSPCIMP